MFDQVSEEKSDMSEGSAFTLVTAEIQTAIGHNSLYQLILDLRSECKAETKENLESSILAGYDVNTLGDNQAWLIHLTQVPENVLFSEIGFKFQGSHLRVDALCAKANTLKAEQGLSACHYTAEYKHPHTNELIIVHAYIGKNGIISYQIKKYKIEGAKRTEIGKDLLTGSAVLKEMIRKNAEPAVALVEKLERERHKRSMKAKEESYEINAKLIDVLQKILTNDMESSNRLELRVEYGKLVESFSEVIARINHYNDQTIDKRDKLLEQHYALMNRPATVKSTESKEANENQIDPADLLDKMQIVTAEENLTTKTKSKKELQLDKDAALASVLITEIKALMEKLKPDELISCQILKQTVTLKLIELNFLSGISQENKVYLKQVAMKLNNIPELVEIFKKAVKNSELNTVIQLYPHVQHENLMPIFNDLIFVRLVPAEGEELNKIIEMAKFFFEHSNCYHDYIRVCEQSFVAGVGCHYSLLMLAFLRQNYLAFECMLKQGFDPNGVGLICEEVTASVVHAIAYFMNSPDSKFTDTQYIKTLLNFGALVDKKTPNVASNMAEATTSVVVQKQVKKVFKKNKMRMLFAEQIKRRQIEQEDVNFLELKQMLSFDSALKMLCSTSCLPRPELLELFAPKSSLASLVAALASLINVRDVSSRLVIGTETPYFIVCPNITEADQIKATLQSSYKCNLRLVNGLENFKDKIEKENEIIIANNNGAFVIFYQNRVHRTIDNFSCGKALEALLLPLAFNGEILVKDQASEKLYKQVYAEVRLNGGYPPADVADKKHVTCIAYHTKPEKALIWCNNLAPLVRTFSTKYHEILEQDPIQLAKLDAFSIKKAKATEVANLLDKTNFLQQALYLQISNPQFSVQNAKRIVETLRLLGEAYSYQASTTRLLGEAYQALTTRCQSSFTNAFLCCTTLPCSKELQATPSFTSITKNLIELGVLPKGLQLKESHTVVHINSVSDSKQPMGSPLTSAAQNHARQTPSLRALANDQTISAPPAVSVEGNTTKRKKKKKKKKK